MFRMFLLFAVSWNGQNAMAQINNAPFVGESFKQINCSGQSTSTRGPWDYLQRSQLKWELQLIEKHHFTPKVEQLKSGQTARDPRADIFFTLRHWPNHHRALNTISIFDQKLKAAGERLDPPAECWLQRGINFSPKDATTHMLYAIYLHRNEHKEEAHREYNIAEELAPRDLIIAYNHGLLLVDMSKFEEASERANLVYASDFPLPGLLKKLQANGYMKD